MHNADDLQHLPHQLDFEGANNFRDLGGYPTTSGQQVRRGMVYRADQLGKLTDADQALLAQLGIRTVVDFRRRLEREEILDRIDDASIRQVWLPVEEEAADVKGLRRLLEEGLIDANGAHQYLVDANEHFIRRFSHVFGSYLELLLEAENYPLVFHCSAGKDRAGFAAALTLFVAGCSETVVKHDYLATNHCTANWVNGVLEGLNDVMGDRVDPEAVKMLMQVRPEFLQRALDAIQEDYGNIAAYLDEGLGFDVAKRRQVRELICEPLAWVAGQA
ncbi:MAG: tyrosine-protein phosphatase [Pseudomonadota bacterium]